MQGAGVGAGEGGEAGAGANTQGAHLAGVCHLPAGHACQEV